jgi:hypothetical protein
MATKNAVREFITVDGQEVLVTKALMLEYAIKALEETKADPAIIRKAQAAYDQLIKQGARTRSTSPAARFNQAKADEVLQKMDTETAYTLNDIMGLVGGLITSNKTAQVMKVLVDRKQVEKVGKKSPMRYKKIAN